MPRVDVSDENFDRVKLLAEPLVDTFDTVLGKLLDAYEEAPDRAAKQPRTSSTTRDFNALSPPDLTHTKVLSAIFQGRTLERGEANWNGLLNRAVASASHHAAGEPSSLKALMLVNYVRGRKTDEGYRFLEDADLSVQGQDANAAWKATVHIARRLSIAVSVTFAWRDKEDAAFPGVVGRLLWESALGDH